MEVKDKFELDVVSIRLVKDAPLFSEKPATTPQEAAEMMWNHLKDFDREVMCVINFKCNMTPINVNFVSMGTVNKTLASPRELLKSSFLSNAAYIMMVHNHPSGSAKPSENDKEITGRMDDLCNMAGIPLIDHIIISAEQENYYSFKEHGLLNKYTDIPEIGKLVAEKLNGRSR